MIRFRLRGLMWRKRINQKELSILTGIRPGTINAYFHGYVKRINTKDLNTICNILDCQVSDLLKHIPDKK